MCDRHESKEVDHYCLEHDELVCEQCATENHAQTPCQSMPLVEASKHVAEKLVKGVAELRKLKDASQSILDGKRYEDTLKTVAEAEELLDKYVDELKCKINNAKSFLRPFSELSREERWKLKAIATKKITTDGLVRGGTTDFDEAKDMAVQLQEVRKQTKNATEVLEGLPNYVDASINPQFINSLSFDGDPVLVTRKGQIVSENCSEADDASSTTTVPQETVYLIQKSHFSLEHCTDIVLIDEYMIASVGDSIQKRDRKRMSFRQALTLPGARKLCLIGETTEVSAMQNNGYVTVLETMPNLVPLYRLMTDTQYCDVSYLESTIGDVGCPEHSPVFVVCYTKTDNFTYDCVDLIQAKRTKYPGRLPTYHTKSRTIADSGFGRHKSRFLGVRSVCAFQGRSIITGALKGATCLSKSGALLWTVDTYRQIIHVMTYRTLAFVCVDGERKILTIGKQGHVIEENILPPMDIHPQKLSANADTLMAKYHDKYEWIIFKKIYENADS